MKILIIGKNGFTSRNLKEYFIGADVMGSSELNLLDENEVKAFFDNNYYDVVIDTAIFHPMKVPASERVHELEYDLRMFHNIAKCHRKYGKLIYFGSGAEYDKRYPICSVTEEDIKSGLIPATMYGMAKYIIGQEIETGIYETDNIYNLRIFGLFGKYENWKTTFISGACCKAVKGIPITIRRDVYFDYLYIDDFCKMIEAFLAVKSPKYRTYNITSGRRVKLTDLAQIVKEVGGKDIPIIVCNDGMANEYTASNERFIKEIGGYDLEDYPLSIEKLYEWYKSIDSSISLEALLYADI